MTRFCEYSGAAFAINISDSEFDGTNSAAITLQGTFEPNKEGEALGTIQQSQCEGISGSDDMERRAQALLEAHSHFVGRARLFEFQYSEEVLVVRGSVPTYYLKQILQRALRDLEGVRLIDNQVTVASCEGIFRVDRD